MEPQLQVWMLTLIVSGKVALIVFFIIYSHFMLSFKSEYGKESLGEFISIIDT